MFFTCLSICTTTTAAATSQSNNHPAALYAESPALSSFYPQDSQHHDDHVGLEMSESVLVTQHVGF